MVVPVAKTALRPASVDPESCSTACGYLSVRSSVAMRLPLAGLAPLRPWAVLYFEPSRWRALQEAVATQLRCPAVELGRLHEIEASRGTAPCKSRRRTTGRRRDVAALEELVISYRAFICEVVAPHVAATFDGPCDELVFQANPTLRVVVPGDRPSGRRHCDADYGHQPGQVDR